MAFTVALNTDENNSHLVYSGGAGLEDIVEQALSMWSQNPLFHTVFLPFYQISSLFLTCFPYASSATETNNHQLQCNSRAVQQHRFIIAHFQRSGIQNQFHYVRVKFQQDSSLLEDPASTLSHSLDGVS